MSYDIYGNPLQRGHCEVHPHVHEEYPCSVCIQENKNRSSQQQSESDYYKIASLEHGLDLSQQRIAELEQREQELAATVERLRGLFGDFENDPNDSRIGWNKKTLEVLRATTPQNLNAMKREVAKNAFIAALHTDMQVGEEQQKAEEYANTNYPSGKDGE